MTAVGLVCADKRIIEDDEFYDVLRYLTNSVGAMIQPEITEEDMENAQENMEKFSFDYKDYFKERACTWKFHMSQHLVEFIRLFGSAAYFDNFNLERLNGELVRRVTTRRNHMKQLVDNYLLKNHSEPLQRRETYHEKTKKFLHNLGIKTVKSFENKWCGCDEEVPFAHMSEFEDVADFRMNFPDLNNSFIRRQTCVSKRTVVVTSEKFVHHGKVDNSYILLRRSLMGRVVEILEVKSQIEGISRFFLHMEVLTRSEVRPDASSECEDGTPRSRTLPDNQFIAEETGEYVWTEVQDGDLVQQMFHGYTTFIVDEEEREFLFVVVQINCAY